MLVYCVQKPWSRVTLTSPSIIWCRINIRCAMPNFFYDISVYYTFLPHHLHSILHGSRWMVVNVKFAFALDYIFFITYFVECQLFELILLILNLVFSVPKFRDLKIVISGSRYFRDISVSLMQNKNNNKIFWIWNSEAWNLF